MFTLVWGYVAFFHPFYISLTDIRYNPEAKSVEIAQRIFWDDLEVALAKTYDKKVDFLNPDDPDQLEALLEDYLTAHNQIHINGKKVQLMYLGHEVEEDAAWFYLEAKKIAKPKSVQITNTLLFSQFEDQQNIVNFYMDEKPKSLLLDKRKETGSLNF